MKQLEVLFSDGEKELWYIPTNETLNQALEGIEEETGLEIVGYQLVKGW